jgi:hypothetical protein
MTPWSCGVLLLALAAPAGGQGKDRDPLLARIGGAEVDWSTGTITVQAGSPADLHMPGPNAARPGAQRRARAAAEEKLAAAVAALVKGGVSVGKDVGSLAKVSRTEYQSDGGVVLWLTLGFSDLVPAHGAPVALRVAKMPLEFAPVIRLAGQAVRLGCATYRLAAHGPGDAILAELDARGELALSAAAGPAEAFAGRAAVIYLDEQP